MTDLDHIYQYLRSADGVNQLQRDLAALDPYFVRMDERSTSDLIEFIIRLSERIRYYDANDQPKGNWRGFFEFPDTGSSVVVKAAAGEPLPPSDYINGANGVGATLTLHANGPLPAQDGVALVNGDLLLVWRQPVPLQNGVYVITQGTPAAPVVLTRAPGSDLPPALHRQVVEVLMGDQHARRFFTQESSKPVVGTSEIVYIRRGLSRNDWPAHLALVMAFLRSYGIAQRDMNELTARHLRYYYENVLRLQRRLSKPDQVHVIFELAKNAGPVLLPAGTLLDAGKLPDGKTARQYSLDSDVVVNQAVIQALRSTYTDVNADGRAIVFKTDDAALVKNDSGTGWRPFGGPQLSRAPEGRTMTEARLGFAMASPALLLAEGERTIKVTMSLNTGDPAADGSGFASAFEIAITGEKGWVTPQISSVTYQAPSGSIPARLVLDCSIAAKEVALLAYNEAWHGPGFKTPWPVMRCILKPYAYQLEALKVFTVGRIDLEVGAKGVRNLVLQNDDNVQPSGKPALPFGTQPGIRNNFYIGSREIFSKSIASLAIHLEWKDPPESFYDHYRGYDSPYIDADQFVANVFILAAGSWNTALLTSRSLFNASSTAAVNTLPVSEAEVGSLAYGAGFERKPAMDELLSYEPGTVQGFIKLVLDGPTPADGGYLPAYAPFEAFGHKSFPTIYTHKAIDLGKGLPDIELPKQPYTPTLSSVALDYAAKETFTPTLPNGVDQYFVLDVFGNAESRKDNLPGLIPKLPSQGALYIGLGNAAFPQTLSFLFRIIKGDVPGSDLLEKTDLTWSYLSGADWQTLAQADIIEEATDTFQQSGVIKITVGDVAPPAGLMPAGQQWVRVMADQRADGAATVQEILMQGAKATFASGMADTRPMAAGTISRLVNRVAAIKSVKQPQPSTDGLGKEQDLDFFRRSSERLRHRNRAVVTWDYERLVMQAFPDVFKVKSLPHTGPDNIILPGHIKLVIVPDMRFRQGTDPLQPRSSQAALRKIERFLAGNHTSPFVALHAANPEYETLLVDCKVAFHTGFDPGFYVARLQEDIRRFLSPWAYEEGRDIVFGGKVYKSEIVAFVEGRSYVDYLVDFQLYHRFSGGGLPHGISCMTIGIDFVVGHAPMATIGSADGTVAGGTIGVDFVIGDPVEIAVATRPDAILVSNAVHRITVWDSSSFQCAGTPTLGIGQMVIGLDFITVS